MRRFIPVIMASAVLAIGGGTLLTHYASSNAPAWWNAEQDEPEVQIDMDFEEARSASLEGQLNDVGRRLTLRVETCRLLVAGKIDLPEAFDIYDELNRESHDPLHPEHAWKTERERLDWIARQISMNVEHFLPECDGEPARNSLLVRIQWAMAEGE